MTDNYNDDYREVIPEEEKTETTLNEKKDNEKNSENTQVADTSGENSAEKKTEDKKDSSEYEDVCFICRRPESKAGRMFKLPNHICICDDCMHKTMETVSQFDYQGMLNNPSDLNQFGGQNGFPNISFVNLADLQGDGGIPNKQKLKKKKKFLLKLFVNAIIVDKFYQKMHTIVGNVHQPISSKLQKKIRKI